MKSGKGSRAHAFDRVLFARIEGLRQSHDLRDVDGTVEHLRTAHREYQRHKVGPFRLQVSRIATFLLDRDDVALPEGVSWHCLLAKQSPLLAFS